MNYIYDIYLNLNEKLYDFFDWNKNDKIIHIKKVPIIKTSEDIFNKIVCNKISVDENLLLDIYNKTEVWNTNIRLHYLALFTDGLNIIAIEFDEKGNSIKKSSLYIDEELEVLETIDKIRIKNIEFKIIKKDKSLLETRRQLKEDKFITSEIKNMEDKKLNYIYFECFGKQEKSKKVIIESITKLKRNSKIYKNLYDILKLTATSKNK